MDRRLNRLTRISSLVVALVAAFPTIPAAAPKPASTAQRSVRGAIEELRTAIEASTLDEAERALALEQLEKADAHERDAKDRIAQLEALRAEAAAWPERMEQLRRELAVDREQALQEWAARLPAVADGEVLEGLLERERSFLVDLGAQIDAAETELAQSLSRPGEAADELARAGRRAEDFSSPVVAPDGEPGLVTDARRIRQASERRAVQAELELRRFEQETSVDRQRVQELELRALRMRRSLDARRVDLLRARIADLTRRELETRIVKLRDQEAANASPPGVRADVTRDNRILGDELVEQSEKLAEDRDELAALEQERGRTAAALRDSRTRLEFGESSDAVGLWLWSERRRLASPIRLRRQLEAQHTKLARMRLRRVTLSESQRELLDIPAAIEVMREAGKATSDDDQVRTLDFEGVEPLLRQRVELLDLLEPVLQRRIVTLEQSEEVLQDQIDTTRELQQLLDRYLLWMPSHAAIDSSWLDRIPEGLADLFKPSRLATTFHLSVQQVTARPIPWVGSLLLLLVLVGLRRRAPAHILEQAEVTRVIREDHFGATLKTFGWTLLAAAPGPVAIALFGELLTSAGTPGRFSDSLGRALGLLVAPLFAVQVLRWTVIEQGLGHAHFRWMRARRAALRRALPRATAIFLPMYFIMSLAFIRNLDLPNDVQARIAIVIGCLVLAWTFWRLLDAGEIWVHRGLVSEPSMLRKVLRIGSTLGILAIAALAVAGFVYSAGFIVHRLLDTLSMYIAITLIVGLVARWFLIGERQLALRRLEESRAARASAAEAHGDAPPEAESEISLEQVNAQTRSLLRALRIGLLVLGLVWIWAGAFQAITLLDEVELWSFTDTDADGTAFQRPVTLMAALLGIVALVLTSISARNLPGLIEIGLLSQTRIDAASRYAITSILRYAIVIAGTLIGLNFLGMRWSQLQWMAAALTVGLGFGLQEIFANFVSGLILLFERPFRVGDVITIADLSGRITRIRTRATTLLDFDNKEIVVPNKSFITGQLVNWTLTDTTTRVVLKLGVAYGTDPDRVHSLLLQAAREHPLVLRDPEPRSWFLAFGASSLDFELRVFVGTLNDRLTVQSDLNLRIARLFEENGIEIAFPQLDLHVRDLPDPAPPDALARQKKVAEV